MKSKQVIVVRTDIFSKEDVSGKKSLDMALIGKMGIQMTHASKAVILNQLREGKWVLDGDVYRTAGMEGRENDDPVYNWCQGAFTGVAVKCKSEAKLRQLYDQAKEAGLPCSYIIDSGLTVFNGVPTPTCVGIGPADASEIDKITGKLRLL